jgi:hypothetical protein
MIRAARAEVPAVRSAQMLHVASLREATRHQLRAAPRA